MPLTALDPRTALIVIDLQEGIRNAALLHPMSDIVACSNQLIDAFREQNLPIVFVTVNGTAPGRTERAPRLEKLPDGFADLMPELRTRPGDTIVTKRTWGAFANTNLEEILKKRGVTQVVLSGVATATGVESTARQAYEAGFHVTLVIDAMSDTREEAHAYSLKAFFHDLVKLVIPKIFSICWSKGEFLMNWLCEVSYFFGGAFLSNAIPHFVSGTMGRPFQTPFAKPPGKGLSSSRVNIVWGIANFVLADLLLARVGQFDLRSMRSMIPLLLGLLVMSLYAARHFGQFYGGNDPEQS